MNEEPEEDWNWYWTYGRPKPAAEKLCPHNEQAISKDGKVFYCETCGTDLDIRTGLLRCSNENCQLVMKAECATVIDDLSYCSTCAGQRQN